MFNLKLDKGKISKDIENLLKILTIEDLEGTDFLNFLKNFNFNNVTILAKIYTLENIKESDFLKEYSEKLKIVLQKELCILLKRNLIIERSHDYCYNIEYKGNDIAYIDFNTKSYSLRKIDFEKFIAREMSCIIDDNKKILKIKSYQNNPKLMWKLIDNNSFLKQKIHNVKRSIQYLFDKNKYKDIFIEKISKLERNKNCSKNEIKRLRTKRKKIKKEKIIDIQKKLSTIFSELNYKEK